MCVFHCLKKEVIAALPKLIKLNPVVVKEVFNRLLGGHGTLIILFVSTLLVLNKLDINSTLREVLGQFMKYAKLFILKTAYL